MQKTPKIKLLQELEKRIESVPPDHIDVTVFDLPQTFGNTAAVILRKVCNSSSKTIHMVFDKLLSPSIKDTEMNARSSSNKNDAIYVITSPG